MPKMKRPIPKDLKQMARARWPELRRGMVVTVYRPWSWRRPWVSALAWGIRRAQNRILKSGTRAHHAMIYIGGGWCASQSLCFELSPLSAYRGCVMRFFDPPLPPALRDHLVAESVVHKGRPYGFRDIAAFYAYSITGRRAWLEALGDFLRWVCSEAVCCLLRLVLPAFAGPGDCTQMPAELELWMEEQNWPCVEMAL